MNSTTGKNLNPRKTFWKCGACSHAMFHLLNHAFDNVKLPEEKASDVLAGGIAQKGHQCGMLCGALGAALCYKMLILVKNNQGKPQTMFNNPVAKNVLQSFFLQTGSEMLCRRIFNKDFNTIDEHSDYIKTGGCSNLIEVLTKA